MPQPSQHVRGFGQCNVGPTLCNDVKLRISSDILHIGVPIPLLS